LQISGNATLHESFQLNISPEDIFYEMNFLDDLYESISIYMNVIINHQYNHSQRNSDQLILMGVDSVSSMLKSFLENFSTDTDFLFLHRYILENPKFKLQIIHMLETHNASLRAIIETLIVNNDYLKCPNDLQVFESTYLAIKKLSGIYHTYKMLLND
jgi:hypothetical protein